VDKLSALPIRRELGAEGPGHQELVE
jgi:hypothetical protein